MVVWQKKKSYYRLIQISYVGSEEKIFLFFLIHLWCPILTQTHAACPPACCSSEPKTTGQNWSLPNVVDQCNLWELGIKHLWGFSLLFWGFSWFPTCWEYWGVFLLEEDHEEWKVVSAEKVKFFSTPVGWGEGRVCSTDFPEPRRWRSGRVTLLQQHVCPQGAGADWEQLQYCFLGTAVQLAAGLQQVWSCTSFPGDFAACLWTWLTNVALYSRLLKPKITEGVKCCSTLMVGAPAGTLPRSQMLSKPD